MGRFCAFHCSFWGSHSHLILFRSSSSDQIPFSRQLPLSPPTSHLLSILPPPPPTSTKHQPPSPAQVCSTKHQDPSPSQVCSTKLVQSQPLPERAAPAATAPRTSAAPTTVTSAQLFARPAPASPPLAATTTATSVWETTLNLHRSTCQ